MVDNDQQTPVDSFRTVSASTQTISENMQRNSESANRGLAINVGEDLGTEYSTRFSTSAGASYLSPASPTSPVVSEFRAWLNDIQRRTHQALTLTDEELQHELGNFDLGFEPLSPMGSIPSTNLSPVLPNSAADQRTLPSQVPEAAKENVSNPTTCTRGSLLSGLRRWFFWEIAIDQNQQAADAVKKSPSHPRKVPQPTACSCNCHHDEHLVDKLRGERDLAIEERDSFSRALDVATANVSQAKSLQAFARDQRDLYSNSLDHATTANAAFSSKVLALEQELVLVKNDHAHRIEECKRISETLHVKLFEYYHLRDTTVDVKKRVAAMRDILSSKNERHPFDSTLLEEVRLLEELVEATSKKMNLSHVKFDDLRDTVNNMVKDLANTLEQLRMGRVSPCDSEHVDMLVVTLNQIIGNARRVIWPTSELNRTSSGGDTVPEDQVEKAAGDSKVQNSRGFDITTQTRGVQVDTYQLADAELIGQLDRKLKEVKLVRDETRSRLDKIIGEKEIQEKQIITQEVEIGELKARIQAVMEMESGIASAVDRIKSALTDKTQHTGEEEQEDNSTSASLPSPNNATIEGLHDAITRFVTERTQLEDQLNTLNRRLDQVKDGRTASQTIDDLEARIESLTKPRADTANIMEDIQVEIVNLNAAKSFLEQKMRESAENVKMLTQARKASKNAELAAINKLNDYLAEKGPDEVRESLEIKNKLLVLEKQEAERGQRRLRGEFNDYLRTIEKLEGKLAELPVVKKELAISEEQRARALLERDMKKEKAETLETGYRLMHENFQAQLYAQLDAAVAVRDNVIREKEEATSQLNQEREFRAKERARLTAQRDEARKGKQVSDYAPPVTDSVLKKLQKDLHRTTLKETEIAEIAATSSSPREETFFQGLGEGEGDYGPKIVLKNPSDPPPSGPSSHNEDGASVGTIDSPEVSPRFIIEKQPVDLAPSASKTDVAPRRSARLSGTPKPVNTASKSARATKRKATAASAQHSSTKRQKTVDGN